MVILLCTRLPPDEELTELQRGVVLEASAWACTELKRRRADVQPNANIFENGIYNGISDCLFYI